MDAETSADEPLLEWQPPTIEFVERLSDVQLDQLPYGVIGLARDGTIVRYNQAEANLARLDRVDVLGKSFWSTVAPCTATPQFKGRVEAFLADYSQIGVRFSYRFDFKFGAQEVDVDVLRGRLSLGPAVYLIVTRRAFAAARRDLPDGFAAPRQSELAPEASAVVRDEREQRRATVGAPFFRTLYDTWRRVAPRGSAAFNRAWGASWGRAIAVDVQTIALTTSGTPLRELPMRRAAALLADYVREAGWGVLTVRLDHADATGAIEVRLARSVIANAVGKGASSEPVCDLFAGMLAAYFDHLAQKLTSCRELCCAAAGDDTCVFLVVSRRRLAVLDAALGRHRRDLPRVLEELRA